MLLLGLGLAIAVASWRLVAVQARIGERRERVVADGRVGGPAEAAA